MEQNDKNGPKIGPTQALNINYYIIFGKYMYERRYVVFALGALLSKSNMICHCLFIPVTQLGLFDPILTCFKDLAISRSTKFRFGWFSLHFAQNPIFYSSIAFIWPKIAWKNFKKLTKPSAMLNFEETQKMAKPMHKTYQKLIPQVIFNITKLNSAYICVKR